MIALWRQLVAGVRVLVGRRSADRDVADEVQHYFDQTVAAYIAGGVAPHDARRRATHDLGGMTAVREQVRGYGWENAVGGIAADVTYAARRLRSSPGFTIVAVTTLALGIGAATAIFSAVRPILFEPLPYPESQQLVSLMDRGQDGTPLPLTYGSYRELVARSRSFEHLAISRAWLPTHVSAQQDPERLDGQAVSANYLRTLRTTPALGRDFDSADDVRGGRRVALLSDALWRRLFGGDSAIIGRQITLDEISHTVIGVMGPDFESPAGGEADIWTLAQFSPEMPLDGPEWGHNLTTIGRLRPQVDANQSASELAAIARAPVPEFARPPWARMAQGVDVHSLRDAATRGVRPALVAVIGSVILVLLIACVNVTNLLLARGAQRHGELAMRIALGAGRGRILRQLLTESLLLSLIGGAVGIGVAVIGVRALVALAPADLPRASAIAVNVPALVFTFLMSTAVGVVIGLIPALRLSRGDLKSALQAQSRRSVGGNQRARRVLVVAEVSLTLVILVGAGLLFRSLTRLFAVDPGFASAQLLTMRIQTAGTRFNNDTVTYRFFAQALTEVRQLPGVRSAAYTSQLPLSGDGDQYGVAFEGDPPGRREGAVFRYGVSPGYFETMGIGIVSGRSFNENDRLGNAPVVILNESFARRKFKGLDPVGRRVQIGPDNAAWATVVGITADVKQLSLAAQSADALYMPTEQSWFADRILTLVVRGDGDVMTLAPAVKRAVWSVDRTQPIIRVAAMDDVVAASAAQRRFALIVLEAFGLVALLLATTGLYGVLSGSVTERLREIGVRSALGASSGDILGMIVRQAIALTAIGIVIGLAGAVAASRLLTTLLYGVSAIDPVTYLGVVALLVAAAAGASLLPAVRATGVDPTIALRAD